MKCTCCPDLPAGSCNSRGCGDVLRAFGEGLCIVAALFGALAVLA